MHLYTDEQTIEDLRIFGRRDRSGVYDLYNHTHTRGGQSVLEEMFRNPLSDKGEINRRSGIIARFAFLRAEFPLDAGHLDMAEKYLTDVRGQAQAGGQSGGLSEKDIHNGVTAVIGLMQQLQDFINTDGVRSISAYAVEREGMVQLLSDPAFEPALRGRGKGKISYAAVAAFDILFRMRERDKIEQLLHYIYYLDAYLSVAKVAVDRKFVFPVALDKGSCHLKLDAVYHPEVSGAVTNDFFMAAGKSLVFLTGANMAGKSTFLRSVSTAMYIAHMGFPVAARSMEFSVMDGIYTTINLPDNLGIGASHFYAEVLRVKKVAAELGAGKSLFVIFDELFRGTNVKDAHEATVAISRAFAGKRTSMFIISSHIVEAGEELKQVGNIGFGFLPTRMKGHTPEYTYTLEEGITSDRHGMIIIRNEGILETLKKGRKRADRSLEKNMQ